MKKINLSILLLAIALCGFAKPIDVTKALGIAQEFCQQQSRITTRTKSASLSLAYQCTNSNIKTRAAGADVYYYVFNKPANQGFIIIAGDDRAKAVLGYSDNGDYPLINQPENFKAWMKAYEEAIKTLMASPENSLPAIKETTANTKSSVAPLLGQIAWNQGEPYNLMCPMDGTERSCYRMCSNGYGTNNGLSPLAYKRNR